MKPGVTHRPRQSVSGPRKFRTSGESGGRIAAMVSPRVAIAQPSRRPKGAPTLGSNVASLALIQNRSGNSPGSMPRPAGVKGVLFRHWTAAPARPQPESCPGRRPAAILPHRESCQRAADRVSYASTVGCSFQPVRTAHSEPPVNATAEPAAGPGPPAAEGPSVLVVDDS